MTGPALHTLAHTDGQRSPPVGRLAHPNADYPIHPLKAQFHKSSTFLLLNTPFAPNEGAIDGEEGRGGGRRSGRERHVAGRRHFRSRVCHRGRLAHPRGGAAGGDARDPGERRRRGEEATDGGSAAGVGVAADGEPAPPRAPAEQAQARKAQEAVRVTPVAALGNVLCVRISY